MTPDPLHYVWWLISRASGVVALVLVSLSVLMGLAMAARVIPRSGMKRAVARLHEHVALAALGAIAVHGLSLLGDSWLKPGLRGIAVPFAMTYRPAFTAAGIVGGYLLAVIGPSFYLRRRIGAGRWRRLHRLSPVIWVLAVVHTLGAGSDATAPWLRVLILSPVAPIVYLFAARLMRERALSQTSASAGRAVRHVPLPPRRPAALGRSTITIEQPASDTSVSPASPVTRSTSGPHRRGPRTSSSTARENARIP